MTKSGKWPDAGKLALLLGATTLVRCVVAGSVPIVAVGAYYWLWGKHLAAGYFDHPPMVAVMTAAFFGWVHGSELAARSGPIVLSVLTSTGVYGLARALFPGGRTAWRATALVTLTPMFALNGVLIQPDNSLALFTVLTWWVFWRAADRRSHPGLWIATGVLAGLMLLAKFHAWVLLPPLWGFLLLSRAHRPLLKTWGPWLAAAVALLVLSPNLVWNARHDWLNYAFQWQRSDLGESQFEIKNVLEFLLGPALMVSPLVFPVMVWGAWKGFVRWRSTGEPALLFLLCAGLPLPLFLGLLSPFVEISPHWPAIPFIALLVLTVELVGRGELVGRRYWRVAMGVCVAMTALACALPLVVMRLPSNISYPFSDGLISTARFQREFLGWREIGVKTREIRDAMARSAPTAIMAKTYNLAAMLAFYSDRPNDVFVFDPHSAQNFEIWRLERGGLAGTNAVVVVKRSPRKDRPAYIKEQHARFQRRLDRLFERVEQAPSLVVCRDGTIEERELHHIPPDNLREFLIFRCYGFKGGLPENR